LSFMQFAIESWREKRDIKALKKYSHIFKSLKKRADAQFNSMQYLKAVLDVQDIIFNLKHNYRINNFVLGLYMVTSVQRDKYPIMTAELQIASDIYSNILKVYKDDMTDIFKFASELFDSMELEG